MADLDPEVGSVQPKKRTFKKFTFRGVDLDALLDMSSDELVELFHARARRRFQRGLKRKPMALIKKLRKAKREAPSGEKPEPVRTHLRNMIIVPEMIGSVIGVYNGKTFNQVEIKVCGIVIHYPCSQLPLMAMKHVDSIHRTLAWHIFHSWHSFEQE
jgi:small subunit ribosomal protein S15e